MNSLNFGGNLSDAFQQRRHAQLAEANEYLQAGKSIPDFLLAELGVRKRRPICDSPDLDTLADDYTEHVKFFHEYLMLMDEIRLSCLV